MASEEESTECVVPRIDEDVTEKNQVHTFYRLSTATAQSDGLMLSPSGGRREGGGRRSVGDGVIGLFRLAMPLSARKSGERSRGEVRPCVPRSFAAGMSRRRTVL